MFSIDSISSVIQNKFSFFVKKGISISPHFVPLNLKLLQRSFGIENNFRTQNDSSKVSSIRQFRDSIFNHLRNKYKNTSEKQVREILGAAGGISNTQNVMGTGDNLALFPARVDRVRSLDPGQLTP